MDHLAIMRKSWGLMEKVLSGKKSVESRWYRTKYPPWDRINPGDTVYFKNSGEPVTAMSGVERVLQFSGLKPEKVRKILDRYGSLDGIEKSEIHDFFEMFKDKKYCVLVFLRDVKRVEPFHVDKSGFGSMSSWITLDSIDDIRK